MPKSSRRKRAKRQRLPKPDPDRLLYTRQEVARMFGVSVATIIRMENAKRLPSLKLGPHKNHLTMYPAAAVRAFAGVGTDIT